MKKPSNRAARAEIMRLSDSMRCHAYNAGYEYAKKTGKDGVEWGRFDRGATKLLAYLRRVLPDPPKPRRKKK